MKLVVLEGRKDLEGTEGREEKKIWGGIINIKDILKS